MTIRSIFLSAAALLGLQACAPSAYNIDSPEPSNIAYQSTQQTKQTLSLSDHRPEAEKIFSYGVLKAELVENKTPVEPISFLSTHAQAEIDARGLNAQFAEQGMDVQIKKFVVKNHRSNGYAPFITFTMLSADVMTAEGPQRIGIFIKRGKVPVWGFSELIEPTMNQPLELVVKEFVAKLNSIVFNQKMSNDDVQSLIANIENPANEDLVYLDVYQLGFSNNDSAVAPLLQMTKSDDEYIRLAAISGLGTLKAENALQDLYAIYNNADIWQDKAMALKSIGDIGTPEALDFLKKASKDLTEANDKEKMWSGEVIDLYL